MFPRHLRQFRCQGRKVAAIIDRKIKNQSFVLFGIQDLFSNRCNNNKKQSKWVKVFYDFCRLNLF